MGLKQAIGSGLMQSQDQLPPLLSGMVECVSIIQSPSVTLLLDFRTSRTSGAIRGGMPAAELYHSVFVTLFRSRPVS